MWRPENAFTVSRCTHALAAVARRLSSAMMPRSRGENGSQPVR
jgi:hypothetical protein